VAGLNSSIYIYIYIDIYIYIYIYIHIHIIYIYICIWRSASVLYRYSFYTGSCNWLRQTASGLRQIASGIWIPHVCAAIAIPYIAINFFHLAPLAAAHPAKLIVAPMTRKVVAFSEPFPVRPHLN
jgi:hypothetical protein